MHITEFQTHSLLLLLLLYCVTSACMHSVHPPNFQTLGNPFGKSVVTQGNSKHCLPQQTGSVTQWTMGRPSLSVLVLTAAIASESMIQITGMKITAGHRPKSVHIARLAVHFALRSDITDVTDGRCACACNTPVTKLSPRVKKC